MNPFLRIETSPVSSPTACFFPSLPLTPTTPDAGNNYDQMSLLLSTRKRSLSNSQHGLGSSDVMFDSMLAPNSPSFKKHQVFFDEQQQYRDAQAYLRSSGRRCGRPHIFDFNPFVAGSAAAAATTV